MHISNIFICISNFGTSMNNFSENARLFTARSSYIMSIISHWDKRVNEMDFLQQDDRGKDFCG